MQLTKPDTMQLCQYYKITMGGSHIQTSDPQLTDEQVLKTVETRTVLLSDVILEAVKVERPKHIIIKMDIESYECKAFLGSPEGKLNYRYFTNNIRSSNLPAITVLTMDPPIVAMTMEWDKLGTLRSMPTGRL